VLCRGCDGPYHFNGGRQGARQYRGANTGHSAPRWAGGTPRWAGVGPAVRGIGPALGRPGGSGGDGRPCPV